MQNSQNILLQADKPLAEQEVNLAASSDRVEAPVAITGPMDSEGGQQFCMVVDLTSNSTHLRADGVVQDTVVSEHSNHPPYAPENGAWE